MKLFLAATLLVFLNCSQLFINTSKWQTVTSDQVLEEKETVQSPFNVHKEASILQLRSYIRLIDFGKDFDYADINKVILHVNGGDGKKTAHIELKNSEAFCYYDYQKLCDKLKEAQIDIDCIKCYPATLEIHVKNSRAIFYSSPAYVVLNSELRILQLADSCECDMEVKSSPPTNEDSVKVDISPAPMSSVLTMEAPEGEDYLCILDKMFKGKINLSPKSKVYKFNFMNDEILGEKIFFETAAFSMTNYIKELLDSLTTESRKNNLRKWIETDTVAFIFEGSASAPEIKTDQITANIGDVIYYKWDRTSNCLVEQTARYNNYSIKNADLPILRASNAAEYFASNLRSLIPDIQSRIFPVSLDPPFKGKDLQDHRVVKIYIIAKPQLVKFQ